MRVINTSVVAPYGVLILSVGRAKPIVNFMRSNGDNESVTRHSIANQVVVQPSTKTKIYKGTAFTNHIFDNELLALFVAAFFAPSDTLVLCDNTAVLGATARRSSRPSWIAIATSILRVSKNLTLRFIPSEMNRQITLHAAPIFPATRRSVIRNLRFWCSWSVIGGE